MVKKVSVQIGSQKFQTMFYPFILQHDSTVYTVPLKECVADNIVSYPANIKYHHNKSSAQPIKNLIGKHIVKRDTLEFTSPKEYKSDQLFIEITVTC